MGELEQQNYLLIIAPFNVNFVGLNLKKYQSIFCVFFGESRSDYFEFGTRQL